MSSRALRWARWLFALSMLGVLGWVLVSDFSDIVLAEALGIRFAVAIVLGTAGFYAASLGWSSLVGTNTREGVAAFGATLPVRHLPLGGLVQIAGLAGAARVSGVSSGTLARATPLFMAATAGGASIVAIPIIWHGDTPWWVTAVVVGTFAATALTGWIGSRFLDVVFRRWMTPLPIERGTFLRAVLWSALAALSAAAGFAVLFPFAPSLTSAVSGWAAAWLCGFLFVITPAGLGVREGVMVVLWQQADAPTVVAAALTHRLSTLGAEIVLFLISWRLTRSWVPAADSET